MSAICGIFHPDDRPIDQQVLNNMLDTLAYRGPDGGGSWASESIGLGSKILFTTPESHQESLPLKNRAATLILTADARVDNRSELIRALDLTAIPKSNITDSPKSPSSP